MTNHIQTRTPADIEPNLSARAERPLTGTTGATGLPERSVAPSIAPPSDIAEDTDAESDETENEEDADEQDASPVDGDTLAPGYHFFAIATAVPCKQDVLLAGLTKMGIQRIHMDQSRPRSSAGVPVREHRFVAYVSQALMIHQRDLMQWEVATPLAVDATKKVADFRQKLEAFELEPGMHYEALFLTRERSQPTRQIVEEHLNEMGFVPHHLIAVTRDERLAARPAVSVAVWFGLLEWDGPASVVTENDPFYFEHLVPVG